MRSRRSGGGGGMNGVFYAQSYHPIQSGSTDVVPHDNAVYQAHLCSSASLYDPFCDPKSLGDPYSTLFVGRLSYFTSEDSLRHAMCKYGRVKSLRLVRHIVTGASRGYAFMEYQTEREMRRAYKEGDSVARKSQDNFGLEETRKTIPRSPVLSPPRRERGPLHGVEGFDSDYKSSEETSRRRGLEDRGLHRDRYSSEDEDYYKSKKSSKDWRSGKNLDDYFDEDRYQVSVNEVPNSRKRSSTNCESRSHKRSKRRSEERERHNNRRQEDSHQRRSRDAERQVEYNRQSR